MVQLKIMFLLLNIIPHLKFEDWLNQFKVEYNKSEHSEIKYIFNEYDNLVNKLRKDLTEKNQPVKDAFGQYISPFETYLQIEAYKIRLEKLQIMLEREILITHNMHKPTGVKYIVARAYWIDMNGGKKYRKFSKNLGAEDKVLVNNVIPEYIIKETKDEITRMMWEQYKLEYPE